MSATLRPLLAALSLLTRAPLPAIELSRIDRQRGLLWFVVVGLALGALVALTAPLLLDLLGPRPAGLSLVALLAVVSGGLHLDGWADCADGFSGGRGQRERTLSIMRDPQIGAHGALALVLLVLFKWEACVAAITTLSATQWIVLPAIGRAALVPLVAWLPAARSDGLAHDLKPAQLSPLAMASVAVAATQLGISIYLLAPQLWLAALCALAFAWTVGALSARRLGGITGDVHGAALELAETAAIAGAAWGLA